jgi:hypothetical protein
VSKRAVAIAHTKKGRLDSPAVLSTPHQIHRKDGRSLTRCYLSLKGFRELLPEKSPYGDTTDGLLPVVLIARNPYGSSINWS